MADLPEYKKNRHAAEPGPVVGGIAQTYSNVGQSISNSAQGTAWIGEIGASIAQDAANQLSTIRGQEEAIRNPGKQLLPAFTESDKHFVAAFEKEAYSGAMYQANDLLQREFNTVIQKPLTSESVNLYEKNSTDGLKDIMQNVPDSVRNKMKYDVLSAYNSSYYQLTKMLAKQNQKIMLSDFKTRYNQNLQSIIEKNKLGFTEEAEKIKKRTLDDVKNIKEYGLITDASSYDSIVNSAFEDSKRSYKLKAETLKSLNGNKDPQKAKEEVIKKAIDALPKRLSPEERALAEKNIEHEYNETRNMSVASRLFDQAELDDAIEDDKLDSSELPDIESKVGGDYFSSSVKKILAKRDKERKQEESAFNVLSNIEHGIGTGKFENKEVVAAYNQMTKYKSEQCAMEGRELGFNDLEQIARKMNDPRTPFKNMVERMALNGSTKEVALAGAAIMRADERDSNHYLDGINKDARNIARVFSLNASAGSSDGEAKNPIEILQNLRHEILEVSKEKVEARKNNNNNQRQKYELNDVKQLKKYISKKNNHGWSKDEIPDEMLVDFNILLDSNASANPINSWDNAVDETFHTLGRLYGYTYINGEKELVKFPLEMFGKQAMLAINKELDNDLKQITDETNKFYSLKKSRVKFETIGAKWREKLPDNNKLYSISAATYGKLRGGEEPEYYDNFSRDVRVGKKTTRITVGGKEKEIEQMGRINIVSDPGNSYLFEQGEGLTYSVLFVPDDPRQRPEPIYVPSKNDVAHFVPSLAAESTSEEKTMARNSGESYVALNKHFEDNKEIYDKTIDKVNKSVMRDAELKEIRDNLNEVYNNKHINKRLYNEIDGLLLDLYLYATPGKPDYTLIDAVSDLYDGELEGFYNVDEEALSKLKEIINKIKEKASKE